MKKISCTVYLILAASILLAGSISGRVIYPAGNDSIYTYIQLYRLASDAPTDPHLPLHERLTPLDSRFALGNNSYLFNGIPHGEYLLQAFPSTYSDFSPLFNNGHQELAADAILRINEQRPHITSVDFIFEIFNPHGQAGLVGSLVFPADGSAQYPLRIFLERTDNDEAWHPPYVAQTDSAFTFSFNNVHPGDYFLRAEFMGESFYYSEEGSPYIPSLLHLENNMVISCVIHLIRFAPVEVCGIVRDRLDRLALPFARVSAQPFENWLDNYCRIAGYNTDTIASGNGQFDLLIPRGFYTFIAASDGYVPSFYHRPQEPISVVQVNAETPNIEINLRRIPDVTLHSISGSITDNDIIPAYPCRVVAVSSDEDEDLVESAEMQDDGAYTLNNLPTGSYYVFVISSDAPPTYYPNETVWENASLVQVATDIATIDFNLASPNNIGSFEVSGLVSSANRTPVNGAPVIAYSYLDGTRVPIAYGFTNAAGEYSIRNLKHGVYELAVTKLNYETNFQNLIIDSSTVLDFDVQQVATNHQTSSPVPSVITNISNYPNPFNPSTYISFYLSKNTHVQVDIYNIKGELVKNLIDINLLSGDQHIYWQGTNNQAKPVSSGVYLYKITANNNSVSNKMILLK